MQPDYDTVNELSGVRFRTTRGPEDADWELPEPLRAERFNPLAFTGALMLTSALVLVVMWWVS